MTEPWWISAVKAFVIINLVLVSFAYLTLIERKVLLPVATGRRIFHPNAISWS